MIPEKITKIFQKEKVLEDVMSRQLMEKCNTIRLVILKQIIILKLHPQKEEMATYNMDSQN